MPAARSMLSPSAIWKTKVPYRHQRRVIEARVSLRRRTDPKRPLPGLLVIGAQRSGTSSVYKYLEAHPLLLASLRKEIDYFTRRYAYGDEWYRAHFASRAHHAWLRRRHGVDPVAYEATPYYLYHPLAPARAAALVPQAKLVALLRDPVERAWSQFQHETRRGRESLDFEAALDAEPERLAVEEARLAEDPLYDGLGMNNASYAAKGRYAEQLERWLEHYPREQLLVLRTEDLFESPRRVYGDILRFAGVPEWYPAEWENHSYPVGPPQRSKIPPAIRERLTAEFAPHNERLRRLLGDDFGWDAAA